MQCSTISQLNLSVRSKAAIEEIRKIDRFSLSLQRVTAGGVVLNIFAGNGPVETTYSVAATDFRTMAQALAAVPSIARRRINNIAQEAAFYASGQDERLFWQAVIDGCKP